LMEEDEARTNARDTIEFQEPHSAVRRSRNHRSSISRE
jgi:hypothetical protein